MGELAQNWIRRGRSPSGVEDDGKAPSSAEGMSKF